MSKRHHETPMDFEYQNGTGPLDARSPFAAVSMNSQRFPASTPNAAGSRKRDHNNVFDSPTRPGASRDLSPNKPLPHLPAAFNSLYATPRKTQDVHMEDSSAGETPKSPERLDDSEAGTPAEKLAMHRKKLGTLNNSKSAPVVPTLPTNTAMSPYKTAERERESGRDRERWDDRDRERERRSRRASPVGRKESQSFLGRIKNSFHSPGRGEIHSGHISKDKRLRRQRSRETQRQLAMTKAIDLTGSGSEAENDDSELTLPRTISPRKRSSNQNRQMTPEAQQPPPPPPKEPHWISSLFTFIGAHPTVPHILSFYAQFFFNFFLLSACAYMIYSFYAAIQADIDKKAFEASADIMAGIAAAAEDYRVNGCASDSRAPALNLPCNQWAKIMAQDSMKVARAKVSAQTFAEIFNSFVEPISYKAMLFTCMIIFGCFAVSNFAFGVLRNKTLEHQHQQTQQAQPFWNTGPPPPTPQRSFSNMLEGHNAYPGTPWHGGPALEPAPSRGFEIGDGQGSPRRRLVYN
ncbi:hypothetical protein Q7P37_003534 [Cladosporium fusiforme]